MGGGHFQRAHLGGIHDDDLVAADEVGLQSRLVFADKQARNGGGETTDNLYEGSENAEDENKPELRVVAAMQIGARASAWLPKTLQHDKSRGTEQKQAAPNFNSAQQTWFRASNKCQTVPAICLPPGVALMACAGAFEQTVEVQPPPRSRLRFWSNQLKCMKKNQEKQRSVACSAGRFTPQQHSSCTAVCQIFDFMSIFAPLPPSARRLIGAGMWGVSRELCDTVMGGVSQCRLRVPPASASRAIRDDDDNGDASATIEGTVRTERNGGFASIVFPLDRAALTAAIAASFSASGQSHAAASSSASKSAEAEAAMAAAIAADAAHAAAADLFRAVIRRGAPVFNAGDHNGCRDLYVAAATTVVSNHAGAWNATDRTALEATIARARDEVPTAGAWTMRLELDRVIARASAASSSGVNSGDPSTAVNTLLLRIRGDGHRYRLRCHRDSAGRDVAYESEFATVCGEPAAVRVPLAVLRARWRGMAVDAPPLVACAELGAISLMASKNAVVGDFALELMGVYVLRGDDQG